MSSSAKNSPPFAYPPTESYRSMPVGVFYQGVIQVFPAAFYEARVVSASIIKAVESSKVEHETCLFQLSAPGSPDHFLACDRYAAKINERVPAADHKPVSSINRSFLKDSTESSQQSSDIDSATALQKSADSSASSSSSLEPKVRNDMVKLVLLTESSKKNPVDKYMDLMPEGDLVCETMRWRVEDQPSLRDAALLLVALHEISKNYTFGPSGQMCYWYTCVLYESLASLYPGGDRIMLGKHERGRLTLAKIFSFPTIAAPISIKNKKRTAHTPPKNHASVTSPESFEHEPTIVTFSKTMSDQIVALTHLFNEMKSNEDLYGFGGPPYQGLKKEMQAQMQAQREAQREATANEVEWRKKMEDELEEYKKRYGPLGPRAVVDDAMGSSV